MTAEMAGQGVMASKKFVGISDNSAVVLAGGPAAVARTMASRFRECQTDSALCVGRSFKP